MVAFLIPFFLFLPALHFIPVPGLPGFLPIGYFFVGMLVFIVLILRLDFFFRKFGGRLMKIDLLISVLLIGQLPSLIASFDTRISVKVFYQWSVALLLYFFISRFLKNKEIKYFYRGISAIVLLASIVMAIQYITNSTWPITPYLDEVLEEERLNLGTSSAKTIGLFLHANSQSLMFTIFLPLVIGFGFSSKRGSGDRVLAFCAFVLGGAAELLTLSRAGIVILSVTLVLMLVLGSKDKAKFLKKSKKKPIVYYIFSPKILFCLFSIFLIFACGLVDPVIERFTSSEHSERDEGSNYARIINLAAGINATVEHPILGIGPGLSSKLYYQFGGWEGFGAHNTYITLSSESGVFIAILYIFLLIVLMKKVWGYKAAIPEFGTSTLALRLGCLGALVSVILNGFFETVMADVFICAVFSVFALCVRLISRHKIQSIS